MMGIESENGRSASWGGCRMLMMAVLLLTSMFAFAGNKKVAADLPTSGDVDVIVQYKTFPTALQFDNASKHGGKMKHDLRGAIKGAAFTVKAEKLAELANDPDVKYISPDRP